MPLIIPMIIQTILLYPSGAVWTDEASNVSRLDPTGAVQADAEHPSRNRVGDWMPIGATRGGGVVGEGLEAMAPQWAVGS